MNRYLIFPFAAAYSTLETVARFLAGNRPLMRGDGLAARYLETEPEVYDRRSEASQRRLETRLGVLEAAKLILIGREGKIGVRSLQIHPALGGRSMFYSNIRL